MKPLFLEMLDELRAKCGFPFTITSGYRDPKHSIEAKKERLALTLKGLQRILRLIMALNALFCLITPLKWAFRALAWQKLLSMLIYEIQTQ